MDRVRNDVLASFCDNQRRQQREFEQLFSNMQAQQLAAFEAHRKCVESLLRRQQEAIMVVEKTIIDKCIGTANVVPHQARERRVIPPRCSPDCLIPSSTKTIEELRRYGVDAFELGADLDDPESPKSLPRDSPAYVSYRHPDRGWVQLVDVGVDVCEEVSSGRKKKKKKKKKKEEESSRRRLFIWQG